VGVETESEKKSIDIFVRPLLDIGNCSDTDPVLNFYFGAYPDYYLHFVDILYI
jgi:hypothetical protein